MVNYYTTTDYLSYIGALPGADGPAGEGDIFHFDLPIPGELDATKRKGWSIEIKQGEHHFGIGDAEGNAYATTVWGYALPGKDAGYLGPTIRAEADEAINVNWKNKLPFDGHLLPIDFSLHLAMPETFTYDQGYIPTVVHLHGGKNRSDSDGLPDQWSVQGNLEVGSLWKSPVQTYDNDQQAAPLWYHDHALGITRLNVYAGLAGVYLLTDDVEQDLIATGVLPGSEHDIPLVIQDKAFTKDGTLYFPALEGDDIPGTGEQISFDTDGDGTADFTGEASVQPEFFGNIITVNGMAWPNHEVDEGMHRFRLLNGSDSRFYVLDLWDDDPENDPVAYLVGTDGGLLPHAIELDGPVVLEPGGRLDLVIDFSELDVGTQVQLVNSGPAFEPFKGFDLDEFGVYDYGALAGGALAANDPELDLDANGDPVLVDKIMQFTVVADTDPSNNGLTLENGTVLAGENFRILAPEDSVLTRKLGLYEGADAFGRVHPLLGVAENTTDIDGNEVTYGPQLWAEPVTEDPLLGSTEVWEFFNFSEDAHPIHVHLTQYQVLSKSKIWYQPTEVDLPGHDGQMASGSAVIPLDRGGDGDLDYFVLDAVPFDEAGEFDWDAADALAEEALGLGSDLVDVFLFEFQSRGDNTLDPETQGWQDTVWVGPGEMISAIMEFEKAGPYVWHCHILSHEDHEMMRPFEVIDPAATVA